MAHSLQRTSTPAKSSRWQLANTDSTATTYTDTGVSASIRHVYQVKAINLAGVSAWSNFASVSPE